MEFIESPLFTKLVHLYVTDHEYAMLQQYLAQNPESGVLIPGSHGLRKIRIATNGHGKRGGSRIIYFFKRMPDEIWLLTIYSKNEVENRPVA